MRRFCAIGLGYTLLSIVACGTSTKELNEKSARALLKEAAAGSHFPISLSPIEPLMTRLLIPYAKIAAELERKGVKENIGGYIVKRLVDAKFVTERTEVQSYPNIRGRFRGDEPYSYDEYDISLVPDTNQLKGIRYQQGQNDANQHQSNVQGMVDEKGLVTLPNGTFQYREDGKIGLLVGNGRTYQGTATGGTVKVTYYVYAYSPELKAQIEKTTTPGPYGFGSRTDETVNGGTYEIGEVSDLQLGATPTMATASFTWTVALNRFGKLYYGPDAPGGNGRVTFVQKPDGTWTLKEWCVVNCF